MSTKLEIDFPMFDELKKKLEAIEGNALDRAVSLLIGEGSVV